MLESQKIAGIAYATLVINVPFSSANFSKILLTATSPSFGPPCKGFDRPSVLLRCSSFDTISARNSSYLKLEHSPS